jgi:hypothetical protein
MSDYSNWIQDCLSPEFDYAGPSVDGYSAGDDYYFPEDYPNLASFTQGTPIHDCDNWEGDVIERPFSSNQDKRYLNVDIDKVYVGADDTFFYLAIDVFGYGFTQIVGDPDTEGNEMNDYFGYEVNNPSGQGSAGTWRQGEVRVWEDSDESVGGTDPLLAEGPIDTNGYDNLYWELGNTSTEYNTVPDGAWARVRGDDGTIVELAVRHTLFSNPAQAAMRAWVSQGAQDVSIYYYHDKRNSLTHGSPYPDHQDSPPANVYEIDNSSGVGVFISPDGSISGTVYLDDDPQNGAIDSATDTPLPNVTIELYEDTNGDGVLSTAEETAGAVDTTVTASDGTYLFSDVPIGNYIVVEIDPPGLVSVLDSSVIDGDQANTNGNDNRIPVNVASNTEDAFNDFLDEFGTTPAIIADVQAVAIEGGGAEVSWITASELGSVAFRLERLVGTNWKKVNEGGWIPSRLEIQGATYRVYDEAVSLGETHSYRITEKTGAGPNLVYGPYTVTVLDGASGLEAGQETAVEERYDYDGIIQNQDTRAAAASTKENKGQAKDGGADSTADRLRILVEKDGIYGLSAAEIAGALGSDVGQIENLLRRGAIHLSSHGQSIPWFAQSGVLYFYGLGGDDHYSLTRTYWLMSKEQGLQMEPLTVEAAGTGPAGFEETLDHEQDQEWWLAVTNDPNSDYWFWNLFSPYNPEFTYELPVPGALNADIGLRIRLRGLTDARHLLSVLDPSTGARLGEVRFTGNTAHVEELTISTAAVDNGALALRIQLEDSPSGEYSAVLLDGFEVAYERAYLALDNSLVYPATGPTVVGGFDSSDIVTLNIGDPENPRWIEGAGIAKAGGSVFELSADLPPGAFASATAGSVLKPVAMELASSSDLGASNKRADYVIITHEELMDGAQALADYRSGDFRTMIVDIQDIYDEFAFGEPVPEAIRSFAVASQAWKTAPRFFVILGDGSFDYRDLMKTGYNFVSPAMFGASNGLFPSDTLLGDLDQDGLPELSFGRIPAKDVPEAMAYLRKLQDYEAGIGVLPTLLIADVPDGAGDFVSSASRIEDQVEGEVLTIDIGASGIEAARSQFVGQLDAGVRLVNYIGHGSLWVLSNQVLTSVPAAMELRNPVTPPFLGLSCLINNFSLPGIDGLGEEFVLNQAGGMVASWAAAGESYNDEAVLLGEAFHQLEGSYSRLGDLILATYRSRPHLVPVYTLLGDPALMLQ